MISALTGIQIGPRQLELPPNMPVFDSAGRYWTLYSWPLKVKHEGMLEVILRERAYAVRTEELVFVEHVGQNAL